MADDQTPAGMSKPKKCVKTITRNLTERYVCPTSSKYAPASLGNVLARESKAAELKQLGLVRKPVSKQIKETAQEAHEEQEAIQRAPKTIHYIDSDEATHKTPDTIHYDDPDEVNKGLPTKGKTYYRLNQVFNPALADRFRAQVTKMGATIPDPNKSGVSIFEYDKSGRPISIRLTTNDPRAYYRLTGKAMIVGGGVKSIWLDLPTSDDFRAKLVGKFALKRTTTTTPKPTIPKSTIPKSTKITSSQKGVPKIIERRVTLVDEPPLETTPKPRPTTPRRTASFKDVLRTVGQGATALGAAGVFGPVGRLASTVALASGALSRRVRPETRHPLHPSRVAGEGVRVKKSMSSFEEFLNKGPATSTALSVPYGSRDPDRGWPIVASPESTKVFGSGWDPKESSIPEMGGGTPGAPETRPEVEITPAMPEDLMEFRPAPKEDKKAKFRAAKLKVALKKPGKAKPDATKPRAEVAARRAETGGATPRKAETKTRIARAEGKVKSATERLREQIEPINISKEGHKVTLLASDFSVSPVIRSKLITGDTSFKDLLQGRGRRKGDLANISVSSSGKVSLSFKDKPKSEGVFLGAYSGKTKALIDHFTDASGRKYSAPSKSQLSSLSNQDLKITPKVVRDASGNEVTILMGRPRKAGKGYARSGLPGITLTPQGFSKYDDFKRKVRGTYVERKVTAIPYDPHRDVTGGKIIRTAMVRPEYWRKGDSVFISDKFKDDPKLSAVTRKPFEFKGVKYLWEDEGNWPKEIKKMAEAKGGAKGVEPWGEAVHPKPFKHKGKEYKWQDYKKWPSEVKFAPGQGSHAADYRRFYGERGAYGASDAPARSLSEQERRKYLSDYKKYQKTHEYKGLTKKQKAQMEKQAVEFFPFTWAAVKDHPTGAEYHHKGEDKGLITQKIGDIDYEDPSEVKHYRKLYSPELVEGLTAAAPDLPAMKTQATVARGATGARRGGGTEACEGEAEESKEGRNSQKVASSSRMGCAAS